MKLLSDRFEFKNNKKGNNGTVLIIGGSKMYTGAPFFSGLAAFRTGTDMVYILTDSAAVLPLKMLLPEAIVMEYSYEEWILKRVNICIFGPGLGRPNYTHQFIIRSTLHFLGKKSKKIIVDGDGIRIASGLNIYHLKNLIFTPNNNEVDYVPELREGQYMIMKGAHDTIVTFKKEVVVEEKACDKRVCGQGDILNGILSSLLMKIKEDEKEEDIILSLRLASTILRRAGSKAFDKMGRSLITRDIIEELPSVFKDEQ